MASGWKLRGKMGPRGGALGRRRRGKVTHVAGDEGFIGGSRIQSEPKSLALPHPLPPQEGVEHEPMSDMMYHVISVVSAE